MTMPLVSVEIESLILDPWCALCILGYLFDVVGAIQLLPYPPPNSHSQKTIGIAYLVISAHLLLIIYSI